MAPDSLLPRWGAPGYSCGTAPGMVEPCQPDFTGCLFINATAEFADHRDPIHQAAKAHKDAYRGFLQELAEATNGGERRTGSNERGTHEFSRAICDDRRVGSVPELSGRFGEA